MQPNYEPNKYYPSRDEATLGQLLEVLGQTHGSVASAIHSSVMENVEKVNGESQELERVLIALGNLRTELDTYTRIVAEYAMRDQNYTLLEAAQKLQTGKSTLSRWRIHPVSLVKPELES